jgi:hypothetical protein
VTRDAPIAIVTRLARSTDGAFQGRDAVARGITRKQLGTLRADGAIERVFRDVYRLTAVPRSHDLTLRAALLWGGL